MRLLDLYGRTGEFLFAYVDNFTALVSYLEKEGSEHINHGSEKNGGDTSAHFACYGGGHPGALYALKQHGANLFQEDHFSRPPFFVAANAGKTKVLEYLLQVHKQANVSTTGVDIHGRSAIHAACSLGSSPSEKAADKELAASLELLLACYPDEAARTQALQLQDKNGYTPVQLAIASGYTAQIKDPNTGELKDTELSKVFLKYGINPATVAMPEGGISHKEHDFFFRTELMVNAFAGSLEIVQRELDNGADPNEGNPQFGGRNALHLACGGISGPDILQAIMKHPATDMGSCDDGDTNAFMFASNAGRLDIVETLVNGVTLPDGLVVKFPIENLNDQDGKDFTALHAAAMSSGRPSGRASVIKLLIETLGIDTTIRDKTGKTALELAESRGNTVVVTAITAAIAAKQAADAAKLTKQTEVVAALRFTGTSGTPNILEQAAKKDEVSDKKVVVGSTLTNTLGS